MKVYTPSEVAEILKVSKEEVMQLVQKGDLVAFPVLQCARIKEEALTEFVNRPFGRLAYGRSANRPRDAGPVMGRKRNRNPQLADEARQWVWDQIRRVPASLLVQSKTRFTANGRQGVLAVSTTTSGPRGDYWFGVYESLFGTELPLFIVPVLADRRIAFLIPYERHKAAFDGLSRDKRGEKKFNIMERTGEYHLTGKGLQVPLPLTRYLNAFDLLR